MPWHLRKLITIVASLVLMGTPTALSDITFPQSEIIIISKSAEHRFTVEVATTMAQRQLGLMHRQTMELDMGMMFDFGQEQMVAMWMKNTLLSLDMLFIDKTGRIFQIEQNTVPLSLEVIAGKQPAASVIELNGGVTEQLEIMEGDQVIHDIFFRKQ